MTKAEVGQLLNLDFFVSVFLYRDRPVPDHKDLRNAFELIRDAEGFEALAWVTLGRQLGCFPRHAIFDFLRIEVEKLSPSSAVESLFPGHADLVQILKSRNKLQMFKALLERAADENPLTTALFKTSLLFGASIAKDVAMRSFTAALNFTTDGFWNEQILGPAIDPDEVMLVLAADDSFVGSFLPEVVCAGLVRAISCMDRFQSIFQGLEQDIEDPSTPKLRQSVSAIVGWRINVRSRRQRLLDLVEKFDEQINKYTIQKNLDAQFGLSYLARNVRRLIRYWNGEGEVSTAGTH